MICSILRNSFAAIAFVVFSSLFLFSQEKTEIVPDDILNLYDYFDDIDEAIKETENERAIGILNKLNVDLKDKGVPNCFECSLHLIKITNDLPPEKKVIAADFAIKLSPDLPDGYFHKLSNTIRFMPADISAIVSGFALWIKIMLKSWLKYCFIDFAALCFERFLGITAFIFLIALFFAKFKSIKHQLFHAAGFSKFYTTVLALIPFIFALPLFLGFRTPLFFVFTVIFLLFFKSMSRTEKNISFILGISFLALVITQKYTLIKEHNPTAAESSIFHAFFNPAFSNLHEIDIEQKYGFLAKGLVAFYSGNYKRSLDYLHREIEKSDNLFMTAVMENMAGIAFYRLGNAEEAVKFLQSSFKKIPTPHTAYNISRIMSLSGDSDKALPYENFALKSDIKEFIFPMILFPTPDYFLEELTRDNDKKSATDRVVLTLLGLLFFLIFSLLIFIFYFKNPEIRLCPECGSVICGDCSSGTLHETCAQCRLIRISSTNFSDSDLAKREKSIKLHVNHWNAAGTTLALIFPGGGHLFLGRTLEGILFTISAALPISIFCCYTKADFLVWRIVYESPIPFVTLFITILLYLFSLFRFFSVRRSE